MHRLELELVIDSFAGGGGASLGIEEAIGRPVDVAINHDRAAIAMHQANHPATRHYQEDVWQVDPVEAAGVEVLEDVAAPAAPVDPWEAEKAKWLGGSLGHVVRWKTSSAAAGGDWGG